MTLTEKSTYTGAMAPSNTELDRYFDSLVEDYLIEQEDRLMPRVAPDPDEVTEDCVEQVSEADRSAYYAGLG